MKLSLKQALCGIILSACSVLSAFNGKQADKPLPDCLTKEQVQAILTADTNPFKEFHKLGWNIEIFNNVEPRGAPIEVVGIKKTFDHGKNVRDCTYKLMPVVGGQFGSIDDGEIKLSFSR